MKKISLVEKNNPELIFAGIALFIFFAFYFIILDNISPGFYYSSEINLFNYIFAFSIKTLCAIWGAKVAIRLNRSPINWGLIIFLFTPIGLILLGSKKIKIDSHLLIAYNKVKSDYKSEIRKIKDDFKNNLINKDEYYINSKNTLEKFDSILNAEIQKIEKLVEEKDAQEIIEKVEGNGVFVNIKDTCPACNSSINEKDLFCPDCGLSLK